MTMIELLGQLGEEPDRQMRRDIADLNDQLQGAGIDRQTCFCILVVIYPFVRHADSTLNRQEQEDLRKQVRERLDYFLASYDSASADNAP